MKLILVSLIILNACVSTKELTSIYFTDYKLPKGVKPPSLVILQAKEHAGMQKFMYGNKAHEITKCTLLRNQFYVATLKTSDDKIKELAWQIEEAYQLSDDDFLQQCKNIQQTYLGKKFLQAQLEYFKN